MIDIEKTLEDLKLLNAFCHGTVLDDAIELLKKQEPVATEKRTFHITELGECEVIVCGNCSEPLMNAFSICWNYCPMCGKKVKWDA